MPGPFDDILAKHLAASQPAAPAVAQVASDGNATDWAFGAPPATPSSLSVNAEDQTPTAPQGGRFDGILKKYGADLPELGGARTAKSAETPAGPTGKPDRGLWDEFSTNFVRSAVGDNTKLGGRFLEMLGELGESPSLITKGSGIADRGEAWGKGMEPSVPSFTDIPGKTVGETAKKAGQFAAGGIGSGVGTSLPSMALGAAAGVAGSAMGGPTGALFGFLAGAAGPSYAMNSAEVFDSLLREGEQDISLGLRSRKELAQIAAAAGIPAAILDTYGLSKFTGIGGKELAGGLARRMLRRAREGSLSEGITESLQETISQLAQVAFTSGNKDAIERITEIANSGIIGAMTGGTLAATIEAVPGKKAGVQPTGPVVPPPATNPAGSNPPSAPASPEGSPAAAPSPPSSPAQAGPGPARVTTAGGIESADQASAEAPQIEQQAAAAAVGAGLPAVGASVMAVTDATQDQVTVAGYGLGADGKPETVELQLPSGVSFSAPIAGIELRPIAPVSPVSPVETVQAPAGQGQQPDTVRTVSGAPTEDATPPQGSAPAEQPITVPSGVTNRDVSRETPISATLAAGARGKRAAQRIAGGVQRIRPELAGRIRVEDQGGAWAVAIDHGTEQDRAALDEIVARDVANRKAAGDRLRQLNQNRRLDVIETVQRAGGVRDDEGHDLRTVLEDVRRPGFFSRKGHTVDAIGEKLWEGGFFGPVATTPRPTESQVLDLLREAAGRRIYPPDQQADAAQEAMAAENRSDLERQADELGISFTAKTTDEELLAAVTEAAEQAMRLTPSEPTEETADRGEDALSMADIDELALERAAIQGEPTLDQEQINEADQPDIPFATTFDPPATAGDRGAAGAADDVPFGAARADGQPDQGSPDGPGQAVDDGDQPPRQAQGEGRRRSRSRKEGGRADPDASVSAAPGADRAEPDQGRVDPAVDSLSDDEIVGAVERAAAFEKMLDDAIAEQETKQSPAEKRESAKPRQKRERKPVAKPKLTRAEERGAAEIAQSFGVHAGKAGAEAVTALYKLFGGGKPGRLTSGLGFDEETYKAAKPHIDALWSEVKAAGQDLAAFARKLVEQFGSGIKPYAMRWFQDQNPKTAAATRAATADQDAAAAASAGFKQIPDMSNEWVKKVDIDEHTRKQFNIRRVRASNEAPYRYLAIESTTFPGTSITGAPSLQLGDFISIDAAIAAAAARMPTGKPGDGQKSPSSEQLTAKPDTAAEPKDILAKRGISVTKSVARNGRDVWELEGDTYPHKDTIKSMGGSFFRHRDTNRAVWSFWNEESVKKFADHLAGQPVADGAAGAAASPDKSGGRGPSAEQLERDALRRREDARADRDRLGADDRGLVSDGTQGLIRSGGEKAGMPADVVAAQIEDIGLISRAYREKKPVFILANAPGTGKTFVLAGAVAELRAGGQERFIYVTRSQDLIDQVQGDFKRAGFPTADIEFVTYSSLSTGSAGALDTSGAVLIFDEAHEVKNIGSARGARGAELMARSRMTILSSATPFENPVQAEYLAPTGIFDRVGGFQNWAVMYGASVRKIKETVYGGSMPKQEERVIVEWPGGRAKMADAQAANAWFRKEGIYTQRDKKLDPELVHSTFQRIEASEAYVSLYNRVDEAFERAAREWRDPVTNRPTNPVVFMMVGAMRVQALKRVMEAAKADAIVERIKERLAGGHRVAVFIETKSEREFGTFRQTGDTRGPRYAWPEIERMMLEWEIEAKEARAMHERPPRRPFSPAVVSVAKAFHDAGVNDKLPSVADQIAESLPAEMVGEYHGDVTAQKASRDKAAFQAGEKRVLIATMAKGGTGLSLHDTVGDKPTVQMTVNLPWSSTQFDQVSGRVARYGLASRAEIDWVFSDNLPLDKELSRRVGGRLRDLGATVRGVELASAEAMSSWDFEHDQRATDLVMQTAETEAAREQAIDAGAQPDADPYVTAERLQALEKGKNRDSSHGYFPTPLPVSLLMSRLAGIRDGDSVLEPSAGTGNLLRFIPGGANVTAVELRDDNHAALQKMLADRTGTTSVMRGDFIEWADAAGDVTFDTIVMNPPFEKRQDAAHVMRAARMLAPGGRLVAIMSEGPFFASDKTSQAFRDMLTERGGTSVKMPRNAFKDYGTGVNTRLVVIDNPGRNHTDEISATDYDNLRDIEDLIPSRGARYAMPPGTIPGFFSRVRALVEQLDRDEAPAGYWKQALQAGVNKGRVSLHELNWTGMMQWLAEIDGKILKSDVLEWLDQHGITVTEQEPGIAGRLVLDTDEYLTPEDAWSDPVAAGSDGWESRAKISSNDGTTYELRVVGADGEGYSWSFENAAHAVSGNSGSTKFETLGHAQDVAVDWVRSDAEDRKARGVVYSGDTNAGGFHGYSLPGGRAHRELLLTLPEHLTPDGKFTNDHWEIYSDGNVIAHMRGAEHTFADGTRGWLWDEMQSDWNRKIREEGVDADNLAREDAAEAKRDAAFDAFYAELSKYPDQRERLDAATEKWREPGRIKPSRTLDRHLGALDLKGLSGASLIDKQSALRLAQVELEQAVNSATGVPDMPFRDARWTELTVKRALLWAAQNGYSRMAWVTGKQTQERYGLIGTAAHRRWVEATEPQSVRELAEDVFGRQMASLMPLDRMDGGVLAVLKHDEVRRVVVSLLSVNVVDVLAAAKSSPHELLSKPDVVVRQLSVDERGAVAAGVLDAARQAHARLRAELLNALEAGLDREVLPALKASDLSPRQVAGVLDPERLFHGGAMPRPEALASTGSGAEPLARSVRGPGAGKIGPAELAGLLNGHAGLLQKLKGGPLAQIVMPPDWPVNLYDRQIPQLVEKILKPYGVKVGTANLDTLSWTDGQFNKYVPEDSEEGVVSVHAIDIPQPAIDALKADGLPLLATAAPAASARNALTREMLTQIMQDAARIIPTANLKVAERLTYPGVGDIRGIYEPVKQFVGLAVNVHMQTAAPTLAAQSTLRHEGIHFLRGNGFISPREWSVLADAAQRHGWTSDPYAQRYRDDPDTMTEEAVAMAFERWWQGRMAGGIEGSVARVFAKIRAFLERLRNALQGRGFTSAQDIFQAIEMGEIGRRREPFAAREEAVEMAAGADDLFAGKTTEKLKNMAGKARDQLVIPGAAHVAVAGPLRAQKAQKAADALPLFGGQEDADLVKKAEKVAAKDQGSLFALMDQCFKDRIEALAEEARGGPRAPDNVAVIEPKQSKDLSQLKVPFVIPTALFKRFPMIRRFVQRASARMNMMERSMQRMRAEYDRAMTGLDDAQRADVMALMLEAEARAQEDQGFSGRFTQAEIEEQQLAPATIKAYLGATRLLDKGGRLVDQHERAMKPLLRNFIKPAVLNKLRGLAAQRGIDGAEFDKLMAQRSMARAQAVSGVDTTAILTRIDQRLGVDPTPETADPLTQSLRDLDSIDSRLGRASIRRIKGYVPHKFFGSWALYKIIPDLEARAEGRLDATKAVLVPFPDTGFAETRAQALRFAKEIAGGDPEGSYVVRPTRASFAGAEMLQMPKPDFERLMDGVAATFGTDPADTRMAIEAGNVRERSMRRWASFKQRREWVAGHSKDINRVFDTHLAEVNRYVALDTLKYEAMSIEDRMGLTPQNKARATLTTAFQAYVRDIMGEKQPLESRIDELFERPWAQPVHVGMASGLAAFLATGGLTANPFIGLLAGSVVGYRMWKARSEAGGYASRALTGELTSMTAHMKLGAFFNVFSPLVNLMQFIVNGGAVLPYRFLLQGGARAIKAGIAAATKQDSADLRLLRRFNIAPASNLTDIDPGLVRREGVAAKLSMYLFNTAERFNRAGVFLGALEQALQASPAEAAKLAEKWSEKTGGKQQVNLDPEGKFTWAGAQRYANFVTTRANFDMTAANRPQALRNVFLRVPLQFKNYIVQQIAFVSGLRGTEIPKFLAHVFLIAGVLGLPGADLLDNVVEWLTGVSPANEVKKLALSMVARGEGLGQLAYLATRGLPAALGFDISTRAGMGESFLPRLNLTDLIGPLPGSAVRSHQLAANQATLADQLRNWTPGLGAPAKMLEAAANGLPLSMALTNPSAFVSALGDGRAVLTSPWKHGAPEFEPTKLSTGNLIHMAIGGTPAALTQQRDTLAVIRHAREQEKGARDKAKDTIGQAYVQFWDADRTRFVAIVSEEQKRLAEKGIQLTNQQVREFINKQRLPRDARELKSSSRAVRADMQQITRP